MGNSPLILSLLALILCTNSCSDNFSAELISQNDAGGNAPTADGNTAADSGQSPPDKEEPSPPTCTEFASACVTRRTECRTNKSACAALLSECGVHHFEAEDYNVANSFDSSVEGVLFGAEPNPMTNPVEGRAEFPFSITHTKTLTYKITAQVLTPNPTANSFTTWLGTTSNESIPPPSANHHAWHIATSSQFQIVEHDTHGETTHPHRYDLNAGNRIFFVLAREALAQIDWVEIEPVELCCGAGQSCTVE